MILLINKIRIWGKIRYKISLYSEKNLLSGNSIAYCFSKYVPISLEEYRKILIDCNAISIGEYDYDSEYYFKHEKDIQKAINILNEKYMTAIRLMGVE